MNGVADRIRENRVTAGIAGLVGVWLAVAPYTLTAVYTEVLITTPIFVLFATAFNLLYGYTGLLSFGHAMFVATAGYVTAKTFRYIGPSLGFENVFGGVSVLATFLFALLLAVVVTTLVSVVVGYFSVRLEEIYFAIITLSFSMAIYVMYQQDIIRNLLLGAGFEELARLFFTNSTDGLAMAFSSIGVVNLFGWSWRLVDISSYTAFYYVTLVIVAVGMYAMWRIVRSPFGTIAKAIRENPERARALGVDVTRHSWIMFIVSGAFSSVAGVLLVTLSASADPGLGYWTFSAEPVLMTVIGGPYAFLGPAAGAFFIEWTRFALTTLSSTFEFLEFLVTYAGSVFGAIVVIVVLFFENGLAGGVRWAARRIGMREGPEPDAEPAD